MYKKDFKFFLLSPSGNVAFVLQIFLGYKLAIQWKIDFYNLIILIIKFLKYFRPSTAVNMSYNIHPQEFIILRHYFLN